MDSEALVQLALQAQSCSQKDLATFLSVSPTQVSKWKKGEHMSRDMEDRLRSMAKIGDHEPSFVLWAGSLENAKKWDKLFRHLAQNARDSAETGYDTQPLADDLSLLSWHTFHVLREMGVTIPPKFPRDLDFDYDEAHLDGENDIEQTALDSNPYASLVYKIYKSLNDVYGFYAAYVSDLMMDEDLDLFDTDADNIEASLIELAAAKLEISPDFAPKFAEFRRRTTKEFEEWLSIVKDKAFRAGIPLRAELLNMVYSTHEALGVEAERESLGFNSSRIHPDVYMNELLCGMRAIHQVLPAILKKLGIDEEFKLDDSEFYLG